MLEGDLTYSGDQNLDSLWGCSCCISNDLRRLERLLQFNCTMYTPWTLELHCIKGSLEGGQYPLMRQKIVLGRGPQTDISFPADRMSSREHAQIIDVGGNFYIEDLKSMNGTYLNDKKITRRKRLKPSDRIRIGQNLFQVRQPSSGLDIVRESRFIKTIPNSNFRFRHSILEENKLASNSERLQKPVFGMIGLLSLILFAVASLWISQDSVSKTDAVTTSATPKTQGVKTFPIYHNDTKIPYEIKKILKAYDAYKKRGQWGNALFTVLWGVSWNPESLHLQKAVTESGRKLGEPAFIFQRRQIVRHTLKVARHSYQKNDPIRISLILTQAILDFQLASGFSGSEHIKKRIVNLNHLARIEMENKLSSHLDSLEKMIDQGSIEVAHSRISSLLHEYPNSTSLQKLWLKVNASDDRNERAIAQSE